MGQFTSRSLSYFLLLPSQWSRLEAKNNKQRARTRKSFKDTMLNKAARNYYGALRRLMA